MKTYEFSLIFAVPFVEDMDEHCDKLLENGIGYECIIAIDEAKSRLQLNFERTHKHADAAMRDAKAAVEDSISGAEFIEAGPDYVGFTDIARFLDMSRQAVRKRFQGATDSPSPIHEGKSAIWNFASVLKFFNDPKHVDFEEISKVAMSLNAERILKVLDDVCSTPNSGNAPVTLVTTNTQEESEPDIFNSRASAVAIGLSNYSATEGGVRVCQRPSRLAEVC